MTTDYKKILIEKVEKYSKEKFFIYNSEQFDYDTTNFYLKLSFFEEFYDVWDDENFDPDYRPDQKFNYYLLIKENFYRTFKKMNPWIFVNDSYVNDYWYSNYEDKIFPNMSKFIKKSYNKKRMNYNGINYIRLKLRVLKNSFIPKIGICFKTNQDRIEFKKQCNSFHEIYTTNSENVKIMATPVKKQYTNLIVFEGFTYSLEYKHEIKISNNLTLKYDNSTKYNTYKNSDEIIEKIIDEYADKDIRKDYHNFRDTEGIFFGQIYDNNEYLFDVELWYYK